MQIKSLLKKTLSLQGFCIHLAESHLQLAVTEKMWAYIKELMITSSQLFWSEMEPDRFLHLLDIVEDAITNQVQALTAKL